MNGDLRSGRLVAWGNAVLAGLVSPDTAADRIQADDLQHRVARDVAGEGRSRPDTAVETLPVFLAGLRPHGVRALLLVLPVPGDARGLPGPPAFNAAALDTGEAVLLLGEEPRGLTPTPTRDPDGPPGVSVAWAASPVERRVGTELPSLGEAERQLTETLREVTEALAGLDLARWRPQVAEALAGIRAGEGCVGLAPGYPGRAHRVLASAQRISAIARLVESEPDAGIGTGILGTRDALLRQLAMAARHATIAAFNSVVEPHITASA
ncbi:MAG: hypothetical protein ACT4QF_24720 [Sporichthyaceae bacterium]